MLIIHSSFIGSGLESINHAQPILSEIITPELPLLHKSHYIFFFILLILNLSIPDAKRYFSVFRQLFARIEDLFRGPFISQQIHTGCRITYPEGFFHLVVLLSVGIFYFIFQNHRCHIRRHIRKTYFQIRRLGYRHITPGHRTGTRMDIHIAKTFSIHGSIGFQVAEIAAVCLFFYRDLMEFPCKIHTLFHMVLPQIRQLHVVIHHWMAFRLHLQNQKIILFFFQQIFQFQRIAQILSVIFHAQLLSILNQSVLIHGADFIGDIFYLRIIFFQCKSQLVILRNSRHHILHITPVHLFHIAMGFIA